MASIVLGVVLTFASTDGKSLALDVTLSQTATVSVELEGSVLRATSTSTAPFPSLSFGPFASPERDLVARIRVAGEAPLTAVVPARRRGLRVAVYGDTRDGDAPHRILAEAIRSARPDVVVHTGDLIRTSNDDAGFARFLNALWPGPVGSDAGRLVPLVVALGNHEVLGPGEGVERLLASVPVPADALARSVGVPPTVFHVTYGPMRFVSIDSNVSLAVGTPQYRYLESLLDRADGSKLTLVAMHHGPTSSGVHGAHPDGAALMELFRRKRVSMVAAGHDHLYERIVADGVTYLVSGGGGAPLYWRASYATGSVAFAPVHHFVLLDVGEDGSVSLEARALEGSVLDRASWKGAPSDPSARKGLPWAPLAGLFIMLVVMGYVAKRILFRPSPGG
ncbi:MAG: metallophosphoesterase [Deltaproteobacteria bacterium]|nr:metallophosphoesterase [Deltaproteobacteria bacterium]